jgi:transcription initiation factor TFIID/TFIIF subunit
MNIVLTPIGAPKGGEQTIQHDLNFQQGRYESTHNVVCASSQQAFSAHVPKS